MCLNSFLPYFMKAIKMYVICINVNCKDENTFKDLKEMAKKKSSYISNNASINQESTNIPNDIPINQESNNWDYLFPFEKIDDATEFGEKVFSKINRIKMVST